MSDRVDLVALAQQMPEITLSPIDALVAAYVQKLLRAHDLCDEAFVSVREIAEAAYRDGLRDGVARIGELLD